MDESFDFQVLGIALLFILSAFFIGVWCGKSYEHKKYEYGCAPDVLRSYTEGYQECKEGK